MAVTKDKKVGLFLLGIGTSFLFIIVLLGIAAVSYRLTQSIIERYIIKPRSMQKVNSISLPSYFILGFESEENTKMFDTQNAQATRVPENASMGQYSLEVEFPAAQEYPAILFEYYGNGCLNWTAMKEFAFDAYNHINADGTITIQIRSGREYPKREYKKDYALPANTWTKVVVTKEELERSIDLDKVSRLAIFMSNPITTYKVNFDQIRVIKEESN